MIGNDKGTRPNEDEEAEPEVETARDGHESMRADAASSRARPRAKGILEDRVYGGEPEMSGRSARKTAQRS